MLHTLIGQKQGQGQLFLENGHRIPVTEIRIAGNKVVAIRTQDKHGYHAVQLGIGTKKRAKVKDAPLFLREVRTNEDIALQSGQAVDPASVFKLGDIVDVLGTSKGKGFAGGVKRHHFKGGPRTHGQSDRERAPGSIGQTTTPGRVYKGKRMAGHMGSEQVTIKNLEVIDVSEGLLTVKGLVPGSVNTLLMIKKVGESKKFVGPYKEKMQEEARPLTPEPARQSPESSSRVADGHSDGEREEKQNAK